MTYHAIGFSAARKRARYIAAFFALNLLFEVIAPLKVLALTGGPSQPEVTSFEPVGTTDMVDLFTGDFTYNIPLFDVGGYPVNISYHAGISMDQEASWVGLGWNINPGAINRGMRGVPDDFMGEDVKKEMNMKTQKTLALKFNTDLEIFGSWGMEKRQALKKTDEKYSYDQLKRMNKLSKTRLGFGIVWNNYKGMGYSLDFQTEISKTQYIDPTKYSENVTEMNRKLKNLKDAENRIKQAEDKSAPQPSGPGSGPPMGPSQKERSEAEDARKYLASGTSMITSGTEKVKGSIDVSFGSQDGSSLSGSLAFGPKLKDIDAKNWSIVPTIGLGYNSFLGLSSFDFGINVSKKGDAIKGTKPGRGGLGAFLPIGNYSYVPNIQMSTLSTSNSFNATVGFDAFGGHPDMRFSGFYNTEELEEKTTYTDAYGYLYEHYMGANYGSDHIMMDFNREKESNGNKNSTHLPMANHTYDVYSVSGQGTGGMYRPHRKTIGILHDRFSRNRSRTVGMNDLGMELGFGANFRFGLSYKTKAQKSSSGLWHETDPFDDETNDLKYRFNYDQLRWPQKDSFNDKRFEQTYFKAAGEQTPADNDMAGTWGGKDEVSLRIGKTGAGNRNLRFGRVHRTLNQRPGEEVRSYTATNPVRNNVISYLTAEECSHNGIGLDSRIISYPQDYWSNYIRKGIQPRLTDWERYNADINNGAQAHHISEITSTGGDGMRYVYGLPAYNVQQKEATFAVSQDYVSHPNLPKLESFPSEGLVAYSHNDGAGPANDDNSVDNKRGADNLYMSTTLPGYAHSYLLTGVLSPDYADLTGDGITDDDYGSAVKFNYHKGPGFYEWRTPYEENRANLDEGYITDNSDDKGSYVYGTKEIWYLQSMESKTHIAEFKLSARHDGHGSNGENGGLSETPSNTLMKLDSIVIYSKIDLLVNGTRATPVKTIVFKYDYSLCKGIPNSDSTIYGKLTLKSIYFTYGNSGKGVLNPYKFTYSSFNPPYNHVHYDRWGNYKFVSTAGVPNRYFPYLDYNIRRDTFDKYASAWNLSQVELPSGGKINVEYEADDYAYVQDRKAMQMFKICGASSELNLNFSKRRNASGIRGSSASASLYDGGKDFNYLYFEVFDSLLYEGIPDGQFDRTEYFKENYLRQADGKNIDYIYYRFKVNMDPRGQGSDHFEYVSGYANINTNDCGFTDDKSYAYVKIIPVRQGDAGLSNCNPIAKQAWQTGLQSLRKVLYPGSDQSQATVNGKQQSAMMALVNSYAQALNIFTGPYQNLRWKHIAKYFETEKSYIRLHNTSGFKAGGGCRVKKITINDNWSNMDTQQESGQYGQEFSYITNTKAIHNTQEDDVISSGVASYEPFVGGDENPFRRPSYYHTNRFMFPDLNEYLEEPFGESFFPAATVGYSRVVVRNIPKPGAVVTSTGKVVHEFYTAKDFPVITTNTPLKYLKNGGGNSSDENSPGRKRLKKFTKALVSMFNVVKRDYMVASQGYSIILNDMHGKPKSTAIYSSHGENSDPILKQFTGQLISGTEYKYKTESSKNQNNFKQVFSLHDTDRFKPAPKGDRLNNTVWVMKENGFLEQMEIATSYDVAVDTRESKSHFRHAGLDFNLENFALMSVPCPYPKYLVNQSLFQSVVITKVIQQYGVLEEVVAYDHSSIVRTKNLVWDEQTGQVLLTATTNEFEDPIYNFTYPAHLVYDGMGPAYKNIDFVSRLKISAGGYVDTSKLYYKSDFKFTPGDELLMRKDAIVTKGWVLKADLKDSTGKYNKIRIIDITGQPIAAGTWEARVIRSGRRNLSAVPVGAITTMNRNVYNYINGQNATRRLNLQTNIVQSSAAVFSDQWQGYIDKGAFQTYHCDTIKMGVEEAHQLLESMINTGNAEDYVFNGASWPPVATSLDNYTGLTRTAVERHANIVAWGEPECGTLNRIIDNIYFGRAFDAPNAYFFKAKYHCEGDTTVRLLDLTCEFSVTKTEVECELDFKDLESISELYDKTTNTAKIMGYLGDDSCEFLLSFPNACYYELECYYIPNCDYYAGNNINPFVNNLQGVWRQKEAFAYHSGRNYDIKLNDTTNIRQDGFITSYEPFWKFKPWFSRKGLERNSSGSAKWVSTGQATLYAPEGNGLEEKDALGIYSSQLFGYNNLLVTAQAGNARHCQIAFDNFEDYFSPQYGCMADGHFDFRLGLGLETISNTLLSTYNSKSFGFLFATPEIHAGAHIAKDTAHTGMYSLCINANDSHYNVRKTDYSGFTFDSADNTLFRLDSIHKLITPFAPTPGKYVISAWVHEKFSNQNAVNSYQNAHVNVKVYNGGSAVVNTDFRAAGMIIDQWQRIDGTFIIPTGADSIKVTLVNDGSVLAYFDDIRLHPFDAKMAGHVYHPVLLKVMAELDDNNYATFYEYDDEGSLVRVKRETEKGIMTIQESRKSIRKSNP